jgi:hypothetical protein
MNESSAMKQYTIKVTARTEKEARQEDEFRQKQEKNETMRTLIVLR